MIYLNKMQGVRLFSVGKVPFGNVFSPVVCMAGRKMERKSTFRNN